MNKYSSFCFYRQLSNTTGRPGNAPWALSPALPTGASMPCSPGLAFQSQMLFMNHGQPWGARERGEAGVDSRALGPGGRRDHLFSSPGCSRRNLGNTQLCLECDLRKARTDPKAAAAGQLKACGSAGGPAATSPSISSLGWGIIKWTFRLHIH